MESTVLHRPANTLTRIAGHVLELDGVRGIAVLLVIVFHFGGTIPAGANRLQVIYGNITGIGWSGVSLFFVLSGFLITGILLRTKQSRNYVKSFYVRRALRILPLYYVSVFLFFDFGLPLARKFFPTNNSVRAWSAYGSFEQVWYWLHISNFHSAFGILVSSPVGHFWSLACEEQFYFIWPWIVLFLSERALTWVCSVLVTVCITFRFLPIFHSLLSVNPDIGRLTPFSVEPLLIGALLAIGLNHSRFIGLAKRLAPVGFIVGLGALIIAASWAGSTDPRFSPIPTVGMTALDLLFASVIAYGAVNRGSASIGCSVLRNRAFTQCGKYSYAMYIFQTPIRYVLLIVPIRQRLAAMGSFLGSALSILIGIALSYGMARCSWKLIEQPFLKLKDRFQAD
jgi:peptidoglycan/LPS O-acetylase OafA/YrhL